MLSFATSMKLRESGATDAAKLLFEATNTTPTRARRILKSWHSPDQTNYSEEKALACIINLSRNQYESLRQGARQHKHDLYPPITKY